MLFLLEGIMQDCGGNRFPKLGMIRNSYFREFIDQNSKPRKINANFVGSCDWVMSLYLGELFARRIPSIFVGLRIIGINLYLDFIQSSILYRVASKCSAMHTQCTHQVKPI